MELLTKMMALAVALQATTALAQTPFHVPEKKAEAAAASTTASKRVNVSIVSATIGPCKADGKKWDGIGNAPAGAAAQIAKLLLDDNPYTGIAQALAGITMASTDKPDPYGFVEVAVDGEFKPNLKRNLYPDGKIVKDTFTPQFPTNEWRAIPLDRGTRFRVTLIDKDIAQDDPIGTVEINDRDLRAALEAEKVYQVKVADQSQNQVLFIGLSVREAK